MEFEGWEIIWFCDTMSLVSDHFIHFTSEAMSSYGGLSILG
jgi:hypothetical protein